MGAGGGSPPVGGKGSEPVEAEGDLDVSPELLDEAEDEAVGESDRIAELEHEVTSLRAELANVRAEAERAARRAEIERELAAAGAIDLEITTPLVEDVLGGMEEPDVAKAVREVRGGKGFLFRGVGGGGVLSEAMAGERAAAGTGLDDLAGDARDSGDRSDLLRYLRARRQ